MIEGAHRNFKTVTFFSEAIFSGDFYIFKFNTACVRAALSEIDFFFSGFYAWKIGWHYEGNHSFVSGSGVHCC